MRFKAYHNRSIIILSSIWMTNRQMFFNGNSAKPHDEVMVYNAIDFVGLSDATLNNDQHGLYQTTIKDDWFAC